MKYKPSELSTWYEDDLKNGIWKMNNGGTAYTHTKEALRAELLQRGISCLGFHEEKIREKDYQRLLIHYLMRVHKYPISGSLSDYPLSLLEQNFYRTFGFKLCA